MTNHPAIRVDGISKLYQVGARQQGYKTLRESIADACWAPVRRLGAAVQGSRFKVQSREEEVQGSKFKVQSREEEVQGSKFKVQSQARGQKSGAEGQERMQGTDFWALKDVSFEVQPGEVVGIIGRNGAGKSTLLKILSRITEPTSGRIELRGRVGSLLEVGTGFHPELTGRENIYMNGSILGMSQREIARKFDEIVAFSEIEDFLDTPVKRYSSGMYVRLAFAVAAHLEPEILIVDEVLAVGDAGFQKKCLGKMQDVAKHGRTVLFVSHNMHAIATLTNTCFLLRNGRVVCRGNSQRVVSEHLNDGIENEREYVGHPRNDQPHVVRCVVHTSDDGGFHRYGEPLRIEFFVHAPQPVSTACFSFQIVDSLARPIAHLWTFDSERPMCRTAGIHRITCEIPKCRLYMGDYRLTVHFSEGPFGRAFEAIEGICPFTVTMHGIPREFPWRAGTCTYLEECDWTVEYAATI
jgi:lipopolysaccharide transport system ATP-binding protein